MSSLVHISEERVRQLLDWDQVYAVTESAMEGVSKNRAIQNARTVTELPNSNLLFTMPGYLRDDKTGALGCKVVSYFPNNTTLPSIMANILLMDDSTGVLKAVVAGTEITTWRTAAASAVATKQLHCRNNKILAIIGAGTQGKIHAIALRYFFGFEEVRVWNRNADRAKVVVDELSIGSSCLFKFCESVEDCVRGADVIVTTTGANEPLLKMRWLKKGVHINAVGVSISNREIDDEIYKAAHVYVDHWDGAKNELQHLQKIGIAFKGQIGDLITGSLKPPHDDAITIFESLGMAVEDCAMARMIFDLHNENLKLTL